MNETLFEHLDRIEKRLVYLTSIAVKEPSIPVSGQSPLLTTRKAAEYLGVSPKTIYNNPKRFKAIKLQSGGLRFLREDLEGLFITTSAQA